MRGDKPMSYDCETEFIFLLFSMEITVADIRAIFQEDELPKSCHEILRERGKAFVETIICEIPYLTDEDNPRLEAEEIGGL